MDNKDIHDYILRIFAEYLKMRDEDIVPDAHFFELGGFSLLALNMVNRINNDLKLSLPMDIIITYPTVNKLAAFIKPFAAGALPDWAVAEEGEI